MRYLVFLSIYLFFLSCKEEYAILNKDPLVEAIDTITNPNTTEVWEPEPRQIIFNNNQIPSDAIVLFGGDDLDAWERRDTTLPAGWAVSDGIFTVIPGKGDIKTKESFGDCQLHIEWRSPDEPTREGQGKGNSGIFFQERYEVQILNSYENRTYSNGQATSIYKQHIPLVNATKPTGSWNIYDIIFHAPKFDSDGTKISSGTFTVIHNGVLVQDHVEIKGSTEYIGLPKNIAHGDGPIILQDHSNEVSYKNIWLRKL